MLIDNICQKKELLNKVTLHLMSFENLYSARIKRIRSSEIRELLEISQQPDMISFAGGLPNPKAFPVEDIKEIVNKVLEEEPIKALQYGATGGLAEFREELVKYAKRHGIEAKYEELFITVGSQQALDLAGRVFIDEGDVIFTALPTYLGAINAFLAYGAKLVGVPLDEDGMRVDLLEEKIKELKKKGEKLKMIYTVPTFQNPAGVELSEERRKRMIELANEHNLIIVEDEPYERLRFEGKPLKAIKSYDKEGRVIYMATFSKILAPGFRLAYVIGSEELSKKMLVAKQSMDLCPPGITQIVAYHYIKNGYIERHIPKIIEMYKRKRDIMLNSLEEYFPHGCKWTRPKGGMFLWVELPKHISTIEMFKDAIAEKVAYVHGKAFHVDGSGENTMRLNFTNPEDEMVEEGIRRLARVIKKRI
ncbi:MAG: PLP-dependent aminotransferase family protein [Thermoplasmatales archaeon]|nr:PLP-dependent aminotransferase family protein [Thermoplasmatales archaeon]